MFYRMKFADCVGEVFKRAGYGTEAAAKVWPEDRTTKWAERGRKAGLSPVEAATLSVADLMLDKLKSGEIERSDVLFVVKMAHLVAHDGGASQKVLERLSLIAYEGMPEAADRPQGTTDDRGRSRKDERI